MKYNYYLLLLVLVLAGCSIEMENEPVNPHEDTVTLTLRGPQTKTMLNSDGSVVWESSDVIYINEVPYQVVVDKDDPSVAYVENVIQSDCYYASCSKFGELVNYEDYKRSGYVSLYIDPYQYYGGNKSFYGTMVAYSETTELHFQQTGGVLRFAVTGNGEKVKCVSLFSNSTEPALSGVQYVSHESIRNGIPSSEMAPNNDGGSISIIMPVNDEVILSSEPHYFDFAVSPDTYPELFFQVFDDTGNVTNCLAAAPVTVERAVIKEMEVVKWEPEEALDVTILNPDTITDEVIFKADTDAAILRYQIVTKSLWDYRTSLYSDNYTLLSNFHYNSWCTWALYKGYDVCFTGYVQNYRYVAFEPDTEYVLIVCHGSCAGGFGGVSYANPTVVEFKTQPSPTIPVIEPEFEVTQGYSDTYVTLVNIKADKNTVSRVECFCDYTSIIGSAYEAGFDMEDSIASLGIDYSDILNDQQAFSDVGYDLPITVQDGQQYTLILRFTSSDGFKKVISIELKAPEGLHPENYQWEVYSTKGDFFNTLFVDMGVEQHHISDLTVEKAVGFDIFRVKNMFKYNQLMHNAGFYTLHEVDSYFYMDARDPENVIVPAILCNTAVCLSSGKSLWVGSGVTWNYEYCRDKVGKAVYSEAEGRIIFNDSLVAGPEDSLYFTKSAEFRFNKD